MSGVSSRGAVHLDHDEAVHRIDQAEQKGPFDGSDNPVGHIQAAGEQREHYPEENEQGGQECQGDKRFHVQGEHQMPVLPEQFEIFFDNHEDPFGPDGAVKRRGSFFMPPRILCEKKIRFFSERVTMKRI